MVVAYNLGLDLAARLPCRDGSVYAVRGLIERRAFAKTEADHG
jgi:hypothetical protein